MKFIFYFIFSLQKKIYFFHFFIFSFFYFLLSSFFYVPLGFSLDFHSMSHRAPLKNFLLAFENSTSASSLTKMNQKSSPLNSKDILVLKVKPYIKVYESNRIQLKDFIDDRLVERKMSMGDFSFYDFFVRYSRRSSFSTEELISLWKKFKFSYFLNFPEVRKKRIFRSEDLKKYLKDFQNQWKDQKGLSTLANLIQWEIPDHVIVENKRFEISKDSLKVRLLNRWQKQCVECEFFFLSLEIPYLGSSLKGKPWKISFPPSIPRNSFSLPLHFLNFKNENRMSKDLSREDWVKKWDYQRTYWIQGRVEIYKRVPVLNRNVSVNKRMEEGDFDFAFRKINFFSERKLPLKKDILGKKLRLGLKAGDILWKSVFLKEKAVKRGDLVKIKMDKKSWSVTLTGKAIQEGVVGDQIKVLNLGSNKVILARVIYRGEVLVQ